MSAFEIRATLDELRRNGARLRQRPAAQTLDSLCRVLDGWSDPDSAWRRELEAALPVATGFSRENVREGLSRALEGWNGEALRELVARELGSLADPDEVGPRAAPGFDCAAILLATLARILSGPSAANAASDPDRHDDANRPSTS